MVAGGMGCWSLDGHSLAASPAYRDAGGIANLFEPAGHVGPDNVRGAKISKPGQQQISGADNNQDQGLSPKKT